MAHLYCTYLKDLLIQSIFCFFSHVGIEHASVEFPILNACVLQVYNQAVSTQNVLGTMYIVSLIKLSLREGNIAILVSTNITAVSNMFSVFSKGIKLHWVIGIHDILNSLYRTYILRK